MAIKEGLDAILEEEEMLEDEKLGPLYEQDENEDDNDDHTSLAWHLDKFPNPSGPISLPARSFSPSSEHSSFTVSPELREGGSSHLKSVLSTLVEDVEAISEGLDQIHAAIGNRGL